MALVSMTMLSACAQGSFDLPNLADSEEAYAETELSPTPAASPKPEPQPGHESLVATAAVPKVEVFKEPTRRRPFATFDHPNSYGTPRVFLVQEDAEDWVRVLLPMRPNGSEGWVRAEDVVLAQNPYRVEVDLGDYQISAYKHNRLFMQSDAAIGTGGTPTPQGQFFTTILAKPSDPASPYGKYAYGLSAYSEVLNTFAGGDGQVAIHGTNQPSLIGTAVSHGCVRVDNPTITMLARRIPLGTPVHIHP
jgi:lipoprotein-anchoring transpeptidase ErfK/SrfK